MTSSGPLNEQPVKALTIRLPEDAYEDLRREAFEKRTSMNALIIEAIRTRRTSPARSRQALP